MCKKSVLFYTLSPSPLPSRPISTISCYFSREKILWQDPIFTHHYPLPPPSPSAQTWLFMIHWRKVMTDLQTLLLFCPSRCSIDKWKCYLIFFQEWVEVKTLKVDEGGRSLITSQQLDVKLDFARYKIKVMSNLRKTEGKKHFFTNLKTV